MKMNTFVRLGKRVVDARSKPYVIAEIGVNHGGSLDLAKHLIDQAQQGGADAAKFQSYKAGKLASKHSPAYWDISKEPTLSQFKLFQKHDSFGQNEYTELAKHCHQVGIEFVSTPFDDDAIEFLDPLVPFFKIASADLNNIPFLRKIAAKGKPVLLSTGASTLGEIDTALDTLIHAGCSDVVLLHCILNYPTNDDNAHLRMINGMKSAYPNHIIGYSDHTMPDDSMTPLVMAYALGAVVIEKHFTHDKTQEGNDHYHAMDIGDLARFTTLAEKAHNLLGAIDHKRPIATESISRKNARRSIVLARSVSAGQHLTADDLTYKRPGTGVSPTHWDEVLHRRVACSLEADHVLQWEDLEPIRQ